MSDMIKSGYITIDRQARRDLEEFIIRQIKDSQVEYDCIVMTGISGILIGLPVADTLEKEILIVRKEKSIHANCEFEGLRLDGKRYVIVDDFVNSGTTIKNIIAKINDRFSGPKLVGIYLYTPNFGMCSSSIRNQLGLPIDCYITNRHT